ncbi:fimbrial protein [Serratia fonticola]|uniref:fimbrial protein n=1 Tax=Serratia fonticola TaxID=47917 RepID=UPI003AAA447E
MMKTTARLLSWRRKYARPIGHFLSGSLALTVLQAQAVTCEFTKLFHENVTIPVVGPGMSTVGENAPIGKVLYAGQLWGKGYSTIYRCTITTPEPEKAVMHTYNKVEVIATPSGVPTRSGDKDIFPTNVPGIGAIFYVSGSLFNNAAFPGVWEDTIAFSWGTVGQGLGQLGTVNVELVKTGPIAAGTQQVLGSSFPTFQISSGSKSPFVVDHVFVTLNFSGATTMYTKTCQLAKSVIDVDLGTHQRSDFTGVGSVTKWEDFDITLKDCPPFVGYGEYYHMELTGDTFGSSEPNQVAISFNSVHGVVENNSLLAKLESGPNSAAGIGIELSERNATSSINLDGTGGFNLQNLPTQDGSSYVIPLKARYVQYETNVKAGIANGATVFTITYN